MPNFENYDDLVEEGIRIAKQFSHIKDIKREFKASTGKDLILTDPTYVAKKQDVKKMFNYLKHQDFWAVDTEVIPSAGRVGLITIAAGNKQFAVNMNFIRSNPEWMTYFRQQMGYYANQDNRHLVFHNRKWDLDHLAKDAIKLFVTDSKGAVKIHDTMVVSRKMGEAGVKGEVGTSNALGEATLRRLGKVLMKGTSGKLYEYVEDVVKRYGMSKEFLRYGASDPLATLMLAKQYYGNAGQPNLANLEGLTPEQLKKVEEADSLDYLRLTLNKAPPGIHQLLSGNSVAASHLQRSKKNPNQIFVKSYLDPNEFVQEEWMRVIEPNNVRAKHDEYVHEAMLGGKSENEAKKIAYERQQKEISEELVKHGINVHSFIAAAFNGEAGYNPKSMIRAAPSYVVRQFAKAMGLVGYDAIDPSRHYAKPFFINPSGMRTEPGEMPGFFKAIELFHRSYNKVPSIFTQSTMDWLPANSELNKDTVNAAINKVYGRLKNGNVDLKRLPKGMKVPELPEGIGSKMYVDAVRYLTKYGIAEEDVFTQPEHFIHEYQRKLVNDLMGLSDLSKYYHDKEFGLGGFRDMVTATFAGRRWTKTAIPLFSAAASYGERDAALRRGDAKEILWDAEMDQILDPEIVPGLLSFQEKKKASIIKHTVSSKNSKKALEEKSFFEQYRDNLFRSSEIAKYMRFGKGWKKDDEEVLASKIRNLEAQGKTPDEIQELLTGEEETLYKALRSPVLYKKGANWTDAARTVVDDELAEKLKSTYYDRREGYAPHIQELIEGMISWKDVKVPQIDENTGKYVRDPEGNVLYTTERKPVFGAPDERLIQVGRSQNIPLTTGWYIGTVGSKIHSLVSKKVFRHDLFMQNMPKYTSKVYAQTDYGKQVYAEDAYKFMTQNDIMKNIPDAQTAKVVAKRIKEMIQEEQVARAAGKGYYSDAQVLKLSRMFTKVMNARVMAKQKARKMWLDSAVDKFGVLKGQVREASRLIPGRHYTGDGISEPVSTWQQGIEHPVDRATHDKMAIRYSRGFKEMAGVFDDANEIGNFMNFIKGIGSAFGADDGATKEEKMAHDHVMKSMEGLVKSRGLDKTGSYLDQGQSILTPEQKKMYNIAVGVSDEMKWLENISGTWRAAVRGEIFHDVNKRTPLFDVQLTDQEGKPLFRSPITTNDISIMERAGKSFLPNFGVSDIIEGKGVQFGKELPDINVPLNEVLGSFNVAGRNILTNRTLGSTVYQITQGILTPALQKYAEKVKAEKAAKAAKAREARQKAMESTFTGSIPVEFEVAHRNKGRGRGTNVSEYDSNDPSTKGDSSYRPENTGRSEADDWVYHKQQFNVRYGRDISKIVRDTGEWAAKSNVQFGDNITRDTYGTIKNYLEYFGPGGDVLDVFGADYAVHTQDPHGTSGFKDLLNEANPHIGNKYGEVMIKAIQESISRKSQAEQVKILSDMMNSVTGYDSLQGKQKKMEETALNASEIQGNNTKISSMYGFLNDATPEYIRDYFGDNPMSDALVDIIRIRGDKGLGISEAVSHYLAVNKDNPDKLSDYWQAVSSCENMSETSALIDEDAIQELVYNKKPYRFDDNNYFGPADYSTGEIAMHPAGFTDLDNDVYKNYARFMQEGFFPAPKMPRIIIPTWQDKFTDLATTALLPTVPGTGLGVRELLNRISGVPDYLAGMGWREGKGKSVIHDVTDYDSDMVDMMRGTAERPIGMLAGYYDKDKVKSYSDEEAFKTIQSIGKSTIRNIISGRKPFSWNKPVNTPLNITILPELTGVPENTIRKGRIRKYAEGTPNIHSSLTGHGTATGLGLVGEEYEPELVHDKGKTTIVDKPTLMNFDSATIIPLKKLKKYAQGTVGLDVAIDALNWNANQFRDAYTGFINEGRQTMVGVPNAIAQNTGILQNAVAAMQPGRQNVTGNKTMGFGLGAVYGATALSPLGPAGALIGGIGGGLLGAMFGSQFYQRNTAAMLGRSDPTRWGRWESEDQRRISSAIRGFEGMGLGDALDTTGLSPDELEAMTNSMNAFAETAIRWGRISEISATDPRTGNQRIANEIYGQPLTDMQFDAAGNINPSMLEQFTDSISSAFSRQDKLNAASTNTNLNGVEALTSDEVGNLIDTLQSYSDSIALMGGDNAEFVNAIRDIREKAGGGNILMQGNASTADVDLVQRNYAEMSAILGKLNPELKNMANLVRIGNAAEQAYQSREYSDAVRDMGFKDVDAYNKYQKKQQRWSNLAAKLKGSGQRGIEETSEIQYSGFFKKGDLNAQHAMAGIQRNMEEFAQKFLEPEMGSKWRSAFQVGTGTVQGGEHGPKDLSTQMNVKLTVSKDLAKRLGGGTEEGFNKLVQDLVFGSGMKEGPGIEKVSYASHTGQRSTAPTTDTSAALRASATMQGYGRRMTALSMGAMGTYFSITGIYGAISQGISMITDSIKDLSSSMKSISIADSFSNGLIKSKSIMDSMGVSQDDFVEGWKRMQSLQSGFQVFLGSIAAAVFKGDNFAKMATGLNDALSGDAGAQLADAISSIITGFIQLIPMALEFAKVMAGVTKFVVENKWLFQLIAGFTLLAFIAQPILTLFAVLLESIATTILLMGYLGPAMNLGGRAFMQLGAGAFTASNGILATNGALATMGAMLTPLIGLVISLAATYLVLSTVIGRVNNNLFILGALIGGIAGLLVAGPMGAVIGAALGAGALSVAGNAVGMADGGEVPQYLADGGEVPGDPNNPTVTLKIGGVNLGKGFNKLLNGVNRLNRGASTLSLIEGDVIGGVVANKVTSMAGGIPKISSEYMANGGPKGTDTVNTWLTPGEFVVNRASAALWMPILKLINGDKKGPSSHMEAGGMVASALSGGEAGDRATYRNVFGKLTAVTEEGAIGSKNSAKVLGNASGGNFLWIKPVDESGGIGSGGKGSELGGGFGFPDVMTMLGGFGNDFMNGIDNLNHGRNAQAGAAGAVLRPVLDLVPNFPDVPELLKTAWERVKGGVKGIFDRLFERLGLKDMWESFKNKVREIYESTRRILTGEEKVGTTKWEEAGKPKRRIGRRRGRFIDQFSPDVGWSEIDTSSKEIYRGNGVEDEYSPDWGKSKEQMAREAKARAIESEPVKIEWLVPEVPEVKGDWKAPGWQQPASEGFKGGALITGLLVGWDEIINRKKSVAEAAPAILESSVIGGIIGLVLARLPGLSMVASVAGHDWMTQFSADTARTFTGGQYNEQTGKVEGGSDAAATAASIGGAAINDTMGGLVTGAVIGSAVPVIGTAIGAAAGAVIGNLIGGYQDINKMQQTGDYSGNYGLIGSAYQFGFGLTHDPNADYSGQDKVVEFNNLLSKLVGSIENGGAGLQASQFQSIIDADVTASQRLDMLKEAAAQLAGGQGTTVAQAVQGLAVQNVQANNFNAATLTVGTQTQGVLTPVAPNPATVAVLNGERTAPKSETVNNATNSSQSTGGITYQITIPITVESASDEKIAHAIEQNLTTTLPRVLKQYDTKGVGI